MISLGSEAKVFLALGGTDLRRGIDGLSMMVSGHLGKTLFPAISLLSATVSAIL
jgi:hypothetical protein